MKILLLTSLYPDIKSTTYQRQTKALHNFTKVWVRQEGTEVLVIKLHYYPLDSQIYQAQQAYQKDQVPIEHCYIFDKGIFRIRPQNISFLPLYIRLKLSGQTLDDYNWQKLTSLLNKHDFRPDIIVGHSMLCFQQSRQLAEHYRLPFVLGFHRSDVVNWKSGERWGQYIHGNIKQAAGIVSRSPSVEKELLPLIEPYSKPLFTAVSGIHPNWIISIDEAMEKLESWKSGRRAVRLISVCALQSLKNIDINLRVLAKLPDSIDYRYEIIGSGEEAEALKSLAGELGLEDRVRFHGHLSHSEVMEKLRKTDIFIMVSSPETLGLAYLEAMARGNIVIGSKGQGIAGIANSPNEVMLVNARDEEDLRKALQDLMLNWKIAQLKEMLSASLAKINQLREETVALDYLKFLEELVFRKKEPNNK